jgi:hypothetical protein
MRHLVAILLVLLAGCAGPPRAPAPDLFSDASFSPPSQPVSTADLFTLSPEMREYLHSAAFSAHLHSRGKQYGLLDALYNGSKGGLKLDYDASYTRNAAETFRDRAGNCMSLVIMTAAFAKELGLAVRYQNVVADESWSRTARWWSTSCPRRSPTSAMRSRWRRKTSSRCTRTTAPPKPWCRAGSTMPTGGRGRRWPAVRRPRWPTIH